jgi:hypothetical protein
MDKKFILSSSLSLTRYINSTPHIMVTSSVLPAPSPAYSAVLVSQEGAERSAAEALWQQPLHKLAAEGLTVAGLLARVEDYGDAVVEVRLPWNSGSGKGWELGSEREKTSWDGVGQEGAATTAPLPPHHTLNRGDNVRLSLEAEGGPAGQGPHVDGVVLDVGPTAIRIEVLDRSSLGKAEEGLKGKGAWVCSM